MYVHLPFYVPDRFLQESENGRYKLVIDLLGSDPYEMHNRITDAELVAVRDHLHRRLLTEMEECGDSMCCPQWACRPWADAHWDAEAFGLEPTYHGGVAEWSTNVASRGA